MPSTKLSVLDVTSVYSRMLAAVLAKHGGEPAKRNFLKRPAKPRLVFPLSSAVAALEPHGDAQELLQRFLDAHLLHFPDNRLASTPAQKPAAAMQPTPKGLAVLQKWFFVNTALPPAERNAVVAALESDHNTMRLVELERSLLNGRLLVSTGVVMLLWVRLLGSEPHIYDLNSLETTIGKGPANLSQAFLPTEVLNPTVLAQGANGHAASAGPDREPRVSPFYHPVMMHPNSRALVQYWDAGGCRLFANVNVEMRPAHRLEKPTDVAVPFVLSGNAILQWVLDCTTVMSLEEGVAVALLLLRNQLVMPVHGTILDLTAVPGLSSTRDARIPARLLPTALYRLTQRGLRLCVWNAGPSIDGLQGPSAPLAPSPSAPLAVLESDRGLFDPTTWAWEHQAPGAAFDEIVDLSLVLREPALKMLFREEAARQRCIESVLCIDHCQQLLLLHAALRDAAATVTRRSRLEVQIGELLAALVAQHLTPGGPLELNLGETQPERLVRALASDQCESGLEDLKMLVGELLRDPVARFMSSGRVLGVPGLRAFVVARHAHRSAPNLGTDPEDFKDVKDMDTKGETTKDETTKENEENEKFKDTLDPFSTPDTPSYSFGRPPSSLPAPDLSASDLLQASTRAPLVLTGFN